MHKSRQDGLAMRETIQMQSKISAMSLGVDVEFTPEETEKIAVNANLPPITDGQEWKAGLNLVDGTIVTRNGSNYLVILSHISMAGWEPENVPALFTKQKEDYTAWVQPLGGHDAYMKGDKVSHKGSLWVSDIDSNIWEPGVYGWTKEVS